MQLALKVKILPTNVQKDLLRRMMVRFNEACNYIADIAFANRCTNKIALQKIVYYDVRERFQLSAQLTIRAIAKVVEANSKEKIISTSTRVNYPMLNIALGLAP